MISVSSTDLSSYLPQKGLSRNLGLLLSLMIAFPTYAGAMEETSYPAETVTGGATWIHNPALLGSDTDGLWSLQVIGAKASLSNNLLNLDLYEKYNGRFLSEEDKEDILDRIPGDQAKLAVHAGAEALSFRYGSFGFQTRSFAGANGAMDKDFVDLLFFGNELDRRYELLNSGSGLAYTSFGPSYGRRAGELVDWNVSLGGTVRYVIAWMGGQVVESRGETVTRVDGISGWGETVVRYSEGTGSGLALDLGMWAMKENWELQLSLIDLGPSISWSKGKEKWFTFEFKDWTFEEETEQDGHAYTKEDSTVEIASWTSPLPTRMRTLVAYHTDWGQIHLLWLQGLRTRAGVTRTPRFQAGTEWRAQPWLRPKFALQIGSPEGMGIAFGLGLDVGVFHGDFSILGFRVPPSRSKSLGFGFNLAFGSI